MRLPVLLALATLPACVSQVMPLLPAPALGEVRAGLPVDVVTKMAGAQDPLAVQGNSWKFSELEHAVARSTLLAIQPWAATNRNESWQLQVELIKSGAVLSEHRLQVSLGVRATLRKVAGQVFVGQTQTFCETSGVVQDESEGREVLWRCISRLSGNLAGWLNGNDPGHLAPEQ